MAITGVFAHPVASTILPLIVFFIFYWRKMELAQLIALRAADLAFTAQMFIVTVSLLLLGVIYLFPATQLDTRQIFTLTTFILLIYVILSLLIGTMLLALKTLLAISILLLNP